MIHEIDLTQPSLKLAHHRGNVTSLVNNTPLRHFGPTTWQLLLVRRYSLSMYLLQRINDYRDTQLFIWWHINITTGLGKILIMQAPGTISCDRDLLVEIIIQSANHAINTDKCGDHFCYQHSVIKFIS